MRNQQLRTISIDTRSLADHLYLSPAAGPRRSCHRDGVGIPPSRNSTLRPDRHRRRCEEMPYLVTPYPVEFLVGAPESRPRSANNCSAPATAIGQNASAASCNVGDCEEDGARIAMPRSSFRRFSRKLASTAALATAADDQQQGRWKRTEHERRRTSPEALLTKKQRQNRYIDTTNNTVLDPPASCLDSMAVGVETCLT